MSDQYIEVQPKSICPNVKPTRENIAQSLADNTATTPRRTLWKWDELFFHDRDAERTLIQSLPRTF